MIEQDLLKLIFKEESYKQPVKLIASGYVKMIDPNGNKKDISNLEITEKGKAFLLDEKFEEDLSWVTSEYRILFKNCNPLKYGDKTECEKKIVKIMSKCNASKEEILQATKKYIDSLNGDYSNNMMARADYFASYTSPSKVEISKLETWLELLREDVVNDIKPRNLWV